MSAGTKKTKGEAGARNAASQPFRLNGWSPDWALRRAGVHNVGSAMSSGRRTINGIIGGAIAEGLGLGKMAGNEGKYERMLAHAEARVTVEV